MHYRDPNTTFILLKKIPAEFCALSIIEPMMHDKLLSSGSVFVQFKWTQYTNHTGVYLLPYCKGDKTCHSSFVFHMAQKF